MNRKERRRLKKQGVTVGAADADSLLRQALLFQRTGRLAEAEAFYRKALAIDPDNPDGLHLLGLVVHGRGDAGGAEPLIRRAIEVSGGNAPYFASLAAVLMALGRPADAEDAARRALAFDAGHGNALVALGSALRERGRLDDAEATLRRAIALWPDSADAHNNLGTVLVARNDAENAVPHFAKAAELNPKGPLAYINLAGALARLARLDEAETAGRQAVSAALDDPRPLNALGSVLAQAGRLDEAKTLYKRAVAVAPEDPMAHYHLCEALDDDEAGPELDRLDALIAKGAGPAEQRLQLHFARAQIADRRGDAERAFADFERGNALRREGLAQAGEAFDADAHDRLVARIAEVFSASFVAERAAFGAPSETPVFVLGMPRSGTTLVEQIAASHPAVHGAGELDDIADLRDRLPARLGADEPFPECARTLDADSVSALARHHLARLDALGRGAARVVDKNPFNFLMIGLIAVLFPAARIVHCGRDARDTGLSCFMRNFQRPHAWTTDLADIGRYLRAYEAMMAHWTAAGVAMHDIVYEDLVADPERESRRLIGFLGLPWDDRCLSFYETKRSVDTASAWQVRRPIYATSVGRWRAYADRLGALEAGQKGR